MAQSAGAPAVRRVENKGLQTDLGPSAVRENEKFEGQSLCFFYLHILNLLFFVWCVCVGLN